jgi:hypothetical protein
MKLNTLMVVALIASTSLATAPAMADDAHHPERAQTAQSASTQATAKSSEQTVKAMQANVKKMQIQLMDHMQTMQESMQMGRGMQAGMTGCPMMGTMGQGGMMMGSGNSTEGRMQQMEKRMDMMEMMMKSGGQGMPGMGKP